jgi:hypothetical protein
MFPQLSSPLLLGCLLLLSVWLCRLLLALSIHDRLREAIARAARPRRSFPQIDALEDRLTPATFFVTNTGDSGAGSLRQAILDANGGSGGTIKFNIPGTGVQTISPLTALPNITQPVFIDGTTEPGFAGKPVIEIEGSSAGVGGIGLQLLAGSDGSVIRDLIINRFQDGGISINRSNNNQILGNYIGTDYTGSVALGNGDGVGMLGNGNLVGGVSAAARNVISGNNGAAISFGAAGALTSSHNVLEGNYIGTDASGTQPLGNGRGIDLAAFGTVSQTVLGGTMPGAGNLIAFNGGAGVDISGSTASIVLGTSIFANGGLGITLSGGGSKTPTPNTPNGAQNFPVLQSAVTSGGVTTVHGTLNSTPSTSFRLEFFANPTPDASGFGQGQTFLGFTTVTTDANGNAAFTASFAAVPVGQFISATSTGPAGTSEFAQDILVTPPPPPPPPPTPSSQPPVLTAFFFQPAPKGEIAVSGFVSDPSGLLAGLPLVVAINWGDGTETFAGLLPSGSFDFFLPQTHKRSKGHQQVTVHVEEFQPVPFGFVDVVTPFVLST